MSTLATIIFWALVIAGFAAWITWEIAEYKIGGKAYREARKDLGQEVKDCSNYIRGGEDAHMVLESLAYLLKGENLVRGDELKAVYHKLMKERRW